MGNFVNPKVYKIAETKIDNEQVFVWLKDLGGEECLAHVLGDDKEKLIELAGRRCYKSYVEKLNPNVTRIRKDSAIYHENVLKSEHGSILEHASISFAIENVSRICCYSDDTDVLTNEGWKNWRCVDGKEKFASLTENNELIFENAEERFCEDYNGKMYSLQTSQIDLLVTPNHRMWIQLHDTQMAKRKEEKFQIKTAEEIIGKRVKYQKGGVVFNGDCRKTFLIPDINVNRKFKRWKPERDYEYKGKDVNIVSFARFLGYYLSEGCLQKKATGISISQNEGHKLNDIVDSIERMGFKSNVFNANGIQKEIRFKFYPLYSWLKENCGNGAKNKKIPRCVFEWDKEVVKEFINAYINGDGNIHKKNGHEVIYTTSKDVADGMQDLALRIGISANIRIDDRVGSERVLKSGQKFYNKNICYIVSFVRGRNCFTLVNHQCKNGHVYIKENGKNDEFVEYHGKIHCVKVKHGLLYVRRNGKACWSGNTHELIRHRAGAAISQESLRFVRLTDINMYFPKIFGEFGKDKEIAALSLATRAMEQSEEIQKEFMELFEKEMGEDFDTKKKLTSAFRRYAPDGLATGIIETFNFRAIRHIITMRTSRHAEEEIRDVAGQIAEIAIETCPMIFGDFEKIDTNDGLFEYVPKYKKV